MSDMAVQIRQAGAAMLDGASSLSSQFNVISGSSSDAVDGGFSMRFQQVLQGVTELDGRASERVAQVDRGESDDLVGAMVLSQEASLSFSMLMQVRNKVVGAVDELVRMQI